MARHLPSTATTAHVSPLRQTIRGHTHWKENWGGVGWSWCKLFLVAGWGLGGNSDVRESIPPPAPLWPHGLTWWSPWCSSHIWRLKIEATYFFVGQRFNPKSFNHMRDPNIKFHILSSKCFAFVELIGINIKVLQSGQWIKRISYPPLLGNVDEKSWSLLIWFFWAPKL